MSQAYPEAAAPTIRPPGSTELVEEAPPSEARARAMMLIDRYLPTFDLGVSRHVLVDADPETTWAALRGIDFMAIRSPSMRAAFAFGLWRMRRARERVGLAPKPRLETLTFDNLDRYGRVLLGEEHAREIAVGAVGTPGAPMDVTAAEFASLEKPGLWKGAGSFSLRPYGSRRTLLSYEMRARATDARARRRLYLYFEAVRPLAYAVMGGLLDHVKGEAECRAAGARAA